MLIVSLISLRGQKAAAEAAVAVPPTALALTTALAASAESTAAAPRLGMERAARAATAVRAAAAVRATRRAVAATLLAGDLESSHTKSPHVKARRA
jgi:hypothetical protein